jgi:hypothetical protein
MFTAGKRTVMTRLQVLHIMAGSLLWTFALSLALYRDYEPLPGISAGPIPGIVAGLLGAVLIESAWSRRGSA